MRRAGAHVGRISTLTERQRRLGYVVCSAAQLRRVGHSDIHVSNLCLGTMLFGEGTSASDACALLDRAADGGVNFFDSAEMYPVPQSAPTQGLSEIILGRWLSARRRSDFVVATKVAGPGGMDWLRGGPAALDAANITAAIDGSLRRLGTDYIDLIQLHWPDR
jgi:aryl-alcohol dehydrogenase-like predicted oxidoreductase